jgi:hypothetical protein
MRITTRPTKKDNRPFSNSSFFHVYVLESSYEKVDTR